MRKIKSSLRLDRARSQGMTCRAMLALIVLSLAGILFAIWGSVGQPDSLSENLKWFIIVAGFIPVTGFFLALWLASRQSGSVWQSLSGESAKRKTEQSPSPLPPEGLPNNPVYTEKTEENLSPFAAFDIQGNTIHIYTSQMKPAMRGALSWQTTHTILLEGTVPALVVIENETKTVRYDIEPLISNRDLDGQFLHLDLSVDHKFILQMEGTISRSPSVPDSTQRLEHVRFQPLFLSPSPIDYNKEIAGKGLFHRGLHFPGSVTPAHVRSICLCDYCGKSFSIDSFHAGFGDAQYFYSGDGMQTLVVNLWSYPEIPGQLDDSITQAKMAKIEKKLPAPTHGIGPYKYHNPFRCPHCKEPYIDFGKYPEIRPREYYGNIFINQLPQRLG